MFGRGEVVAREKFGAMTYEPGIRAPQSPRENTVRIPCLFRVDGWTMTDLAE